MLMLKNPLDAIYKSGDSRLRYCVFSFFKLAAVRHLGLQYLSKKIKFLPISSSLYKIW